MHRLIRLLKSARAGEQGHFLPLPVVQLASLFYIQSTDDLYATADTLFRSDLGVGSAQFRLNPAGMYGRHEYPASVQLFSQALVEHVQGYLESELAADELPTVRLL